MAKNGNFFPKLKKNVFRLDSFSMCRKYIFVILPPLSLTDCHPFEFIVYFNKYDNLDAFCGYLSPRKSTAVLKLGRSPARPRFTPELT